MLCFFSSHEILFAINNSEMNLGEANNGCKVT